MTLASSAFAIATISLIVSLANFVRSGPSLARVGSAGGSGGRVCSVINGRSCNLAIAAGSVLFLLAVRAR